MAHARGHVHRRRAQVVDGVDVGRRVAQLGDDVFGAVEHFRERVSPRNFVQDLRPPLFKDDDRTTGKSKTMFIKTINLNYIYDFKNTTSSHVIPYS